MSTSTNNLEIIHFNPFVLTPLLISFYTEYGPQPKGLLLSPLILPLVLHPISGKNLETVTKASSLRTFRLKRENLFGLENRVASYRRATSLALVYAHQSGSLIPGNELSMELGNTQLPIHPDYQLKVKAAGKLGRLLNPWEIPTICRLLGLKAL